MRGIAGLLLVLLISSCAGMKPAADAALAFASFPECRAEWERFVPVDLQVEVAGEYRVIDSFYTTLVRAAQTDPDVTMSQVFRGLGEAMAVRSRVERAFAQVITAAYLVGEDNEYLLGCRNTLQTGWAAAWDNPTTTTAVELLRAVAPYARVAAILLMEQRSTPLRNGEVSA